MVFFHGPRTQPLPNCPHPAKYELRPRVYYESHGFQPIPYRELIILTGEHHTHRHIVVVFFVVKLFSR